MTRLSLRIAAFFFIVTIGPVSAAHAQSFDAWFDKKISDTLDAQQVGQNGKGADKQRESPAGDTRSTSLVDQTSSTDFVSAAVNLAAAGQSGAAGSGSQTVTASLYALLAGLNGNAPTDPRFYADHVNARRASFTIGTAASDPKTDNSDTAATVVGGKLLLINGRELYRRDNLERIRAVQKALSDATKAGAILKRRIQEILFLTLHAEDGTAVKPDGSIDTTAFGTFLLTSLTTATFPVTLANAGPAAMKKIDAEILNALSVYASLRDEVQHTYDRIQQGAQLAVIYTTTVRKAGGFNNHRAAIAYDYGLSPRVTWTANGSVDYFDKKAFGSSRSGRVATEFIGDLTSSGEGWSRAPIRLSFSGEITWASDESTATRLQTKLTIPIAAGFDLPIVYRYGKADAQSASGSEARVGLSVDLSRLMQSTR